MKNWFTEVRHLFFENWILISSLCDDNKGTNKKNVDQLRKLKSTEKMAIETLVTKFSLQRNVIFIDLWSHLHLRNWMLVLYLCNGVKKLTKGVDWLWNDSILKARKGWSIWLARRIKYRNVEWNFNWLLVIFLVSCMSWNHTLTWQQGSLSSQHVCRSSTVL